MSRQRWDFDEALRRCRLASSAQRAAERALRHAVQRAAEAEKAYRAALATEIRRLHDQDKVAWSVAPELARGTEHVADLRRQRDLAEGLREVQQQVTWRRTADRKDAQRFADWSQRRELADLARDHDLTGAPS